MGKEKMDFFSIASLPCRRNHCQQIPAFDLKPERTVDKSYG
jgi:hypothetical protein